MEGLDTTTRTVVAVIGAAFLFGMTVFGITKHLANGADQTEVPRRHSTEIMGSAR